MEQKGDIPKAFKYYKQYQKTYLKLNENEVRERIRSRDLKQRLESEKKESEVANKSLKQIETISEIGQRITSTLNVAQIVQAVYDNIDTLNIIGLVPCKFEFLLVLIKIGAESHDITSILKNNKNYYYVVNNYLFNESFMNWLFINHIKKKFVEYNIYILDNMTNEIVLNKTQCIHLQQDNYKLINNE